MKTTQRNGTAGFTLIELMAVITIIIILAGLVVGGLGYVSEKQASSKAKVQIALLSKALEEYKLDMGTYPPTSASNDSQAQSNSTILYTKLFYEGYQNSSAATPDPNKAPRVYLTDLDPRSTKQGWVDLTTATTPPASLRVNDPWSNSYGYRTAKNATGAANASTINPDFDLWSLGKDGKSNTGTPSDRLNRDDIKNF